MRRPAPESIRELLVRAEALAGRTVAELATVLGVELPARSVSAKGTTGQLVELALGADPEAGDGPDFPRLGIELKTIPVGALGRPAESTFVCSITMTLADREEWKDSRLRRRLAHVLFVPVTAAKLAPLAQRRFGTPRLWEPSPTEEALLRGDWEELMGTIGAGGARALSAHRGHILQVRPKASSARVRTWGPGVEGPMRVLPLGFYLRPSFTAQLLHPRSSGDER